MSHVLIVDDRAANRELLATVLGYCGHSVAEAADGLLALTQVSLRRPDLVITDLLMPNMDGEALCRQLLDTAATADVPIIIHTASYRARQARQIAQHLGVKWVLAKPSEPAENTAGMDWMEALYSPTLLLKKRRAAASAFSTFESSLCSARKLALALRSG